MRFLIFVFFLFLGTSVFAEDPYEVLGVSKQSSHDEIKTAYRRLSRKYHPDFNPGDRDAAEKMKEINAAWALLSDPDAKARYDRYGTEAPDESLVRRDEIGKKYSNRKWRYEPSTGRFYDNRIKKWLTWNSLWNKFYTEEGWMFDPETGHYFSNNLRAQWYPEKSKDWFRDTGNTSSDRSIPIDPKTGFALSVEYEPRTVSDASDLFDEVFNPVNFLEFDKGKGNRPELLSKLNGLKWTPERKADYIERAKEHIRMLQDPDMQIHFGTDAIYFDALATVVLDTPQTLQLPEIVVYFVGKLPEYHEMLAKKLLFKETWFNHPNAHKWLRAFFRTKTGTEQFIRAAFRLEGTDLTTVKALEKAFPLMSPAGMTPEVLHWFLTEITYSKTVTFVSFRDRLLEIANTEVFWKMITSLDPKYAEPVEKFLNWYSNHDQAQAYVFKRALSMPGTRRDDYWRINDEGSQYSMHEREYEAAKKKTTRARLSFLQQSLSEPAPFFRVDPEPAEDEPGLVERCEPKLR